ncbi:ROK family protein, partial [Streptomyces sp. NPDC056728]
MLGAVEVLPGVVRAARLSRTGVVLGRTEAFYDTDDASPDGVDAALERAVAVFAGHRPVGVGVA